MGHTLRTGVTRVSLALLIATTTAVAAGIDAPISVGLRVAGGHGTDAWVFLSTSRGTVDAHWVSDRHPKLMPTTFDLLPSRRWWPHVMLVPLGGPNDAGSIDIYKGAVVSLERGFHARWNTINWGQHRYSVGLISVAGWLPLIVLAVLPGRAMIQHIRARRRPVVGHCPKCGYDLRASPDRCPECGAMRGSSAGNAGV